MSYNKNQVQYNKSRNNTRVVAENKKFCKVCKDAGKTESEYTSHFVRASPDANSKVVCPTLLEQKCRHCDQAGHTYKYCPMVIQKEKEYKRREQEQMFAKEYQKKQSEELVKLAEKNRRAENFKCGAFSSIMILSSDDEDEDNILVKRRQRRERAAAVPVPSLGSRRVGREPAAAAVPVPSLVAVVVTWR